MYVKYEGKFWVGRIEDAWKTCTHKKAVAVAIFTLVWNLSSILARIWAGKQFDTASLFWSIYSFCPYTILNLAINVMP